MISKTGLYVIRAASALARRDGDAWVGAVTLAKETGAPANYLGKLLHALAREGIVLSRKGVRGGVKLARPASEILLYDLLKPFEDYPAWTECLLGQEGCPDTNPCALSKKWVPVREQVIQFLLSTTVADTLHGEAK